MYFFTHFDRGMEEYGSGGMDELIRTEAQPGNFLSDVDFFCISVCIPYVDFVCSFLQIMHYAHISSPYIQHKCFKLH
jgi:hypothetical protein